MRSDDERRNHARFPFSSRLEVRQRHGGQTPAGEDVERVARATAFDVSVGGLGFKSVLPLAIGDMISVALGGDVEDDETFADPEFLVHAVVRHVKRDGGEYVIGAERRAEA